MQKPLALVTGGAHRLGRSFALTLARRGYAVAIVYHTSGAAAEETAREIRELGVTARLIRADLRDAGSVPAIFSQLGVEAETLAVAVNCAADWPMERLQNVSVEAWDSTLNTNLRAPFLISQRAAQCMANGGLIVNISDIGASKTWTRYPAYSISKAGLEALTRLLAREFAPSIRVNAIALGLVLRSDKTPPLEWERLVRRLPMKRAATLEEACLALEFLMDNGYVTGQTIVVDGGYSLI